MNSLTETEIEELYQVAEKVSKNSYSPYSGLAIGAAVLGHDGSIYSGTNVENASYGLTICAERIAIGNFVSGGAKNLKAIAIYSDNGAPPCGACRQFISEFGENIQVIFKLSDILIVKPIAELLPLAFNKHNIPPFTDTD